MIKLHKKYISAFCVDDVIDTDPGKVTLKNLVRTGKYLQVIPGEIKGHGSLEIAGKVHGRSQYLTTVQ